MQTKPNVIWILTDQQRFDTLSVNGSENSATPNLDMLARTGANFTNAYSGFPLCCPFRGSMLTGVYPHKCVAGHEKQLNPIQKTIADEFNKNGYDTFYLGKWHLDGCKEADERAATHYIPRERRGGFNSWIGYENNNAQYDCYLHGHCYDDEVPMHKLHGYETDEVTNIFLDYLRERREDEKPFFAVMSVQPPHDPYVAPAEHQKRHTPAGIKFRPNVPDTLPVRKQAAEELSGYYAMIENIDLNVGRVVDFLRHNKMLDNTHIIFFSDHGDMHGSHGQFRKMTAYQEAVHIPFVISGEQSVYNSRRVGEVSEVMINHVDIAPTTLGLCGITPPDYMEGTDYSAVRLTDKPKTEYPDSVFLQSVIPTHHGSSVNKPWRGIVTADGYKYACFENTDWMLFDLKSDPYEQVNLAHDDAYAKLRQRLNIRLQRWIDDTQDSFKLPPLEV